MTCFYECIRCRHLYLDEGGCWDDGDGYIDVNNPEFRCEQGVYSINPHELEELIDTFDKNKCSKFATRRKLYYDCNTGEH